MSDDTVVVGAFGKKDEELTASRMFEIMAEELDGVDDVEAIVVLQSPGHPTALMGNVEIDRAALMVMLAQVAITDTYYGGDNGTIH